MFETDTLRTGADGTVGITLKDDTRVSLGPASEVRIERYMYAPGEGGFAMVLRFARGVAAYVSGRILFSSGTAMISGWNCRSRSTRR